MTAPTPLSDPGFAVPSRAALWGGRIMSGLPAAFLLVDAVMKFVAPPAVVEGTMKYGYPMSSIFGMGVALLASTILYLIPRTTVLGAILLTGYLGGAVATHVRAGEGWFNILFPVFFGCLLWGGLWFRDGRIRRILPMA